MRGVHAQRPRMDRQEDVRVEVLQRVPDCLGFRLRKGVWPRRNLPHVVLDLLPVRVVIPVQINTVFVLPQTVFSLLHLLARQRVGVEDNSEFEVFQNLLVLLLAPIVAKILQKVQP